MALQVRAEPSPGRRSPAAGLAELVQYEAEVRRQSDVPALLYFVANESQRLLAYDQLFVLRAGSIRDRLEIVTVSNVAVADRNAPLIQAIERTVNARAVAEPLAFNVADHGAVEDDIAEYPFHQWLWQPLLAPDGGGVFGGLLLARTTRFTDAERTRVARIGETVGHAWRALTGGQPVRQLRRPTRRQLGALLILALIALAFPVRMSAQAPVEVVAARPYVLAAPVNGVISRIHVVPNATVKKGDPLISFDSLKLGNDLQLAKDQVAVARARAERANSEAFGDAARAREIAVTRAELELAEADLTYAKAMFDRRRIVAPRDGTAIYSDRRDWEGRAVKIGDPIMQLADPRDVLFRIDLPAREQMTLAAGDAVEVFLDAQPLWSIAGRIETASYQARMTPEQVIAFALTARPVGATPRIGSRGTARVYGRWVPLAYALLRRPIASFRQFIGY